MSNLDLIHKYCNSRNTKYLDKLDRSYAVLFQKLALYSLTKPNANHEISKEVLKYYNINEQGQRKNLKDRGRKKVEGQLNSFSVNLTGARSGDVLVGSSKGSKGAVMRIHGGNVPPQKNTLDGLRYYPDLWEKFLVKLGSIPFFADMDVATREVWFDINEADNENSIGQEGARLEIIQPGTGLFVEKLSESDLDQLIQGNPESDDTYWSYEEIENMIPRKAGSQARRHTLILIRSFWRLAIDYKVTNEFRDLIVDVENGQVLQNQIAKENQEIFVIGSITKKLKLDKRQKSLLWVRPTGKEGIQDIGIMVSKDRVDFNRVDEIIQEIFPCDISAIRNSMKGFTGAAHKSLLQKIIRFRPTQVDIGRGKLYDARSVLLVCMADLAVYPGAFIPDIQRYVTGMESFTKRIAVTIYEDSSISKEYFNNLFSLLAGAMLIQRVRTWVPTKELFVSWLRIGLLAWEQTMAYKVDYKSEISREPYVLKYDQDILKNASAVLDELRSFPTDLGLARGWAREYPNIQKQIASSFPGVMPLCHCVDQHWAPQVAYYFNPKFVYKVSKGYSSGQPFRQLFSAIWDTCSSINPRRNQLDFSEYEKKPEVLEIRKAQNLFLTALQTIQYDRQNLEEIFEMSYTLNDAWIAGMVGAIEVKPPKHPHMLVTLSGDDPLKLVVIRRPSRNMVEDPLTPEDEEMAIQIAKSRLKLGIAMNKANAPDPVLKNAKVYLIESEEGNYYAIQKEGENKSIPWNDIKELNIALYTHPANSTWSIKTALTRVGSGVEENAEESLHILIDETDNDVIRRALIYLSTYNSNIEMNRISRDGSGTYQAVLLDDVAAYQFILHLTTLYPAAIAPNGPGKFKVRVGPLLWTLCQMIKEYISDEVSKEELEGWNKVRFSDNTRELRSYQQEMVNDMIENQQAGNKGNFIWATVGLGKTMSVLSYLQYRKENNLLPLYIIYTLPESAIKSIIQEIKYFDVPINLIIPLADIQQRRTKYTEKGVTISQSCEPIPFAINLIEHDHLRRCEETLTRIAPKSIFVVDEVHKTLNDTKRTSVALEIAQLSRDFIVLTGTPIIDNNTYKLIEWLEQVVPYEVNAKNFWVAANSMIAKKLNTGVKVIEEEIVAPFTKEEENRYKNLVPPTLGGTNVKPSQHDWMAATDVCYDSANREMIRQVQEFINQNRGVMLVAKDGKHSEILHKMVIKGTTVSSEDIYVMKSGDSIFLTDEAVSEGKIHDYKVVIVPIKKAEGYTLTRLSAMVTSVYPSNNATRTQIQGRINRVSQRRPEIDYRIVHVGVLTAILRNHNQAKNLELALAGLAKEIK